MLDRFEQQVIRAALGELGHEFQSRIDDADLQARLNMVRFLLAHSLGRQGHGEPAVSIAQEAAALRQMESDEQRLLQTGATAAAQLVSAEILTSYLRDRLGVPALSVKAVRALLGGFSKQTYLLELQGGEAWGNRLVLRRDQEGGPVEVKTADEYVIIKCMHDSGVPVPQPLLVDRAPPFGATAMVMRMAPGHTAYDVTGTRLGQESKSAALALARVLGRIHRVPVSAIELSADIAEFTLRDHVQRQVRVYEAQWKRRRVDPSPTLEAAFAWLYKHIPDSGSGPVLVHGDASLRNLLVENGRESAMLDWELWHVGDANEDLAYCRKEVEAAVDWEVFIQEYLAHGGLPYDASSASFYEVFGAVRNAVFAQSCLHGFIEADCPQSKFAYGALALGRGLVCELAERLDGR